MKLKKIEQSTIALMIAIIVSKLIGMLRDIVLANYFGTSNISDAYLIASSVPVLLFYFIGQSLSTVFIPMYNKIKYQDNDGKALKFTNNILNVSFIISTVIVILLLFFPSLIIKIFAAGFDKETTLLAASIIRICCFSIYVMSLSNIFIGFLQANKNFIAPAIISLPRNVIIISSIILAAKYNISYLGWGLLFAYIFECLFLLPFTIKKGYKYNFVLDVKDKYLKESYYIILPILLGLCVSQVNKIIDRSIASTVLVGGVSALSYASIINTAVQEVLVTGIITILFSDCAKYVAQKKYKLVSEKLSNTIKNIAFFIIPAMIGVIILAQPIVSLILCRGSFDSNSIRITTGALRYYSAGMIFFAVTDTLIKVFYAYKDTKITTIASIASIILNIILNIVLSRFMGINGLAFATSISSCFNCVFLYIALYKKIGDFNCKENIIFIFKYILCGLFMSIFTLLIYNRLGSNLISLFSSIIISVIIYFIITLILRVNPIFDKFKNMRKIK